MLKNILKNIWLGSLLILPLTLSAQAADFKWMDDKGELYQLSEAYKGQPVVVHFWASWCPPCVAEMPEMAAWAKEHPQVNMLVVSLDHGLEEAQSFLKQNNIDMPTLLTDNAQSSRMAVRGLPTTILINADGQAVSSHIGMQDWQQKRWEDKVLALFPVQEIVKNTPP